MNQHLPSERTESLNIRGLMEESLEVLRNYRHDLMNQVQLLQAYSQMKKYDRLQDPIQALVAEAQRHTEWSSFPSSAISYVVLSRDILYPMMQLHASYEQTEEPMLAAELLAANVLSDLLDFVGEQSQTVIKPIPIDVWIGSFGQGYEIGWFLAQDQETAPLDWTAWVAKWQPKGVVLTSEAVEDGVEYQLRLQVNN